MVVRGAQVWAGAAAAVCALLLPAVPASAAEAGGARGSGGVDRHAASGASYGSSGSCVTWATGSGDYGLRCAGRHTSRSFRDLLGGAEVPRCWLVAPGSADLTPSAPQITFPPNPVPPAALPVAVSNGILSGVSPTTAPTTVPAGEPVPSATPTGVVVVPSSGTPVPAPPQPPVPTPVPRPPQELRQVCFAPPPDPESAVPSWDTELVPSSVLVSPDDPARLKFFWELTEGQQEYARLGEKRTGTIKSWGVATSPSTTPRIGQVIAFSRFGVEPVVVGTGETRMRARMLGLTVQTGEPGRPSVTCTGAGLELMAGAVQRTGAGICSFAYHQTSAGRDFGSPDNYHVVSTETWAVEVSNDAGATWATFRQVQLERDTGLRVTEVQTLVVPLDTP
ncbi:MAG: hypothetical protein ACRYF3_15540 [Janthinobacterium lividum]